MSNIDKLIIALADAIESRRTDPNSLDKENKTRYSAYKGEVEHELKLFITTLLKAQNGTKSLLAASLCSLPLEILSASI